MPEQDGFELYKRFYPWPDKFRLGDPVLVQQVTGMRWPEFCSALDEIDPDEPADQVVMLGLIAVSFWQGNPQMSREKVRRIIERMPQDELDIIEGDVEDDVVPPAEAEDGDLPLTTSPVSIENSASN